MKILNIFLIILITIFIFIRFIGLDYAPPSLSNDEISIAYDAYSISQTLKDEHNHFLPISFQSHGTYKAPMAIYLSAPLTMILGNTDYSARIPSAFFGSLTIIALYLLINQLSKNSAFSLLTAALLAITPLNIYTSRMALEANIALFFVVFGLYLFFRGIYDHKNLLIIFSALSFVLSIYSYHTEWGFIPILAVVLGYLYRHKIIRQPIFYLSGILFLILVTPVLIDLLSHIHEHTRASTEIIFKDPKISQYWADSHYNVLEKLQVLLTVFLDKYSSYTNLSYIFFRGANLLPENSPYQIGLFLWPFIIPFVVGIFCVKRFFPRDYKFIYLFLLTSPIIPALTIGEINNIRNLIITIPISIIISCGLLALINHYRGKSLWIFGMISTFLIASSLFYFLTIYFYYFPMYRGINYQYGYKQIAQFIQPRYSKYNKIIIDSRFGTKDYYYSGVPHLYIPYYTLLDPTKLQNRKQNRFSNKFDKYEIRDINWQIEKKQKGYLYITPADNIPTDKDFVEIQSIFYPDRTPAFNIYNVN